MALPATVEQVVAAFEAFEAFEACDDSDFLDVSPPLPFDPECAGEVLSDSTFAWRRPNGS